MNPFTPDRVPGAAFSGGPGAFFIPKLNDALPKCIILKKYLKMAFNMKIISQAH